MQYLEYMTMGLVPAFILMDLAIRKGRHASTRWWQLRGSVMTVVTFFMSAYVMLFWNTLLGGFHLFNLSGLGTWAGALVGVLAYELAHYSYHRAAHRYNWLWRLTHQMHHSAESLDAIGAFWLHPLDNLMFTSISSLVFYPLLGLALEAGLVGGFFLTFNAMFQHSRIRTPKWLGYFIQRPESHSIHHGRGMHRFNYADLPLIDMLFGTFRNGDGFRAQHGFYDGASERVIDMLMFRDVSRPGTRPPGRIAQTVGADFANQRT
jgi:sterol desaturase/sphingolipid hydroxylase (fatty acid hydroxylase superfamily)